MFWPYADKNSGPLKLVGVAGVFRHFQAIKDNPYIAREVSHFLSNAARA
jgi:hypothetical protein